MPCVARHDRPVRTPEPAQLCSSCLDGAQRDVKALVRDYADLENVLPDVGGRLEKVSGTHDPGIPLSLGADGLQRDIWHTLTTWEEIVREHCGLPEVPFGKVRDGWAVQRAAGIIAPRVFQLATIEEVACFPDGPEAKPSEMTGAQALMHMSGLHRTVGWAIGLRHLRHNLPGQCWQCNVEGGLRRDDGSETVYCELCSATSTWDDYLREVAVSR